MVGNGNVALDVARMLALTPEELAGTDTTDPAIEAIVGSGLREIVVLGRRGPGAGGVDAGRAGRARRARGRRRRRSIRPQLELDAASEAELAAAPGTVRRNVDILRDYAARVPAGKPRVIRLRFCTSPVALLGDGRVEAIEVVRNELVADERGRVRAVPTGERERIPCGIVFRSVGYQGVALPGVPFDEDAGTIANRNGRVLDGRGEPVPGVYCAGWIKRGPSGVIGTNKKDATETVELLLEDAAARGCCQLPRTARPLEALLAERGVEPVLYAGLGGDRRARAGGGAEQDRPRVKLCTWDELLAAARVAEPGAVPGPGPRPDPGIGRSRLGRMSEVETRQELWGGETRKAIANFPVSGEPIPAPVARWLGRIKAAAARVNAELGLLDADKAERIAAAGERIAAGELDDQFPIDVFQTGSGTSSNMNANEVIAALAGEDVHPNDDVNMGQSSNDVFPSAVHLAALGRDHARPAPRARRARGRARGEGARVRRRGQVRPDAPDGRRAGHARPGVRRLRGAGPPGHGPRRVDARTPRPDPARRHGHGHRAQHPPRVRLARTRASTSGDRPHDLARPPTRSRRRPRATRSSRRRARSRSSRSR